MYENWQYAALSELSYRRANSDQALDLREIVDNQNLDFEFNGAGDELPTELQAAGLRENGGHLYTSSSPLNGPANPNGFSAFVINDNGQYTIVFRGTDLAGDDAATLGSYAQASLNPFANSPLDVTRQDGDDILVDGGDTISNLRLGQGVFDSDQPADEPTQWQTAQVLVEFILSIPGVMPEDVTVVGQSLGGGLAGLAAAVYGLEGFLFGPAPFQNQLIDHARENALEDVLEMYSDAFSGPLEGELLASAIETDPTGASFLNLGDLGLAGEIRSRFFSVRDTLLSQYNNHIDDMSENGSVFISSVEGEFTTNHEGFQSALGNLIDVGSGDFRPEDEYNLNFSIGEFLHGATSESLVRHSPALHALFSLAESGSSQFDELLEGNGNLRAALFSQSAIAKPLVSPKQGLDDDVVIGGEGDDFFQNIVGNDTLTGVKLSCQSITIVRF